MFKILHHIIAFLAALLGWFCIQALARHLYMPTEPNVDFWTMNYIFWQTQDWFFRLLVIFNNVVKPIAIYGFAILICRRWGQVSI